MKLIRKAAALVLLAGIITSTGFVDKFKEIFSLHITLESSMLKNKNIKEMG